MDAEKDKEKVCEYLRKVYLEGEEYCDPEQCMVCRNGKWLDSTLW